MTTKKTNIKYPSICSRSAKDFYIEHKNINEFNYFVFGMALKPMILKSHFTKGWLSSTMKKKIKNITSNFQKRKHQK